MKFEYKKEYIDLWKSCEINDLCKKDISERTDSILENKRLYTLVGISVNVPWYLIACIHSLESDLDFKTHLHNGDSLSNRTIHVPSGRPKEGNPPFLWEFSAADALLDKINGVWKEDIGGIREGRIDNILYALESYNGLGYKQYHSDVKTPYLWSRTNHYTKGKYVKDGKFDSNAVSSQIGVAAILKTLEEKKIISPLIISDVLYSYPLINSKSDIETIMMLQVFMNSFSGNYIDEDGLIGPKTKKRFKEVFGFDLI